MAAKAYSAHKIFTGHEWLEGYAVIIDKGVIKGILHSRDLPSDIEKEDLPGKILAPAFIDLQVYGAHGKLFAVNPDTDSLKLLNDYSNNGGAAHCMPTVATNQLSTVHQCIDAIRSYWRQGGEGILGLHVEGPWINPVKRGAHIESLIHNPTKAEVEALLAYGKDVIRIITLAPEVCNREIIELIQNAGIKIFAGHSNASYE
jgi:N-acetylglucosamine-6-phosphate deacetylase